MSHSTFDPYAPNKIKGRRKPASPLWALVPVFLVVALVAATGYALWSLERRVHYNWSYKAMVEETIRERVKPEALK
jgi:hypothetical protein